MPRAIGIDLGTTYSCAAVVDGGKPQVIRSRLGYTTIPSIVTFDEDGTVLAGQPAERRMALHPHDTIYGHKRLLGRTFLKGVVQRFQPHFRYELVADDDGFVAARVCGRMVPLVEASALILTEIRRAAEQGLGEPVDRAVITVPAYFNENQRALVREAGRRARLQVIRILNEPTAAALCFGFNRQEKRRLLVFDLGGGTFDVSIVEADANTFTVLGTDGDTFLGGLDFDRRLADMLLDRLEKKLRRKPSLDPVGIQRLRAAAQEAKHQLSLQEKTVVQLPGLALTEGGTVDLVEALSRAEFEAETKVLVDRTMEVTERALAAAGLKREAIDDVLLVGGQTRMPAIQRRLRELFDREPTKRIHPDEVVALGAAIAASAQERGGTAAVLRDVVPLSLGVGDINGQFRVVVPANTRVPHEGTIRVGVPPDVTVHKVAVYQGERMRAADNEYLGMLVLDDLPPSGTLRDLTLRFQLDAECLLKVRATLEGTGIDREVALATQQTPDEVLESLGQERIRAPAGGKTPAPQAPKPPRAGTARPPPGVATAARARTSLWQRLFGWLRR